VTTSTAIGVDEKVSVKIDDDDEMDRKAREMMRMLNESNQVTTNNIHVTLGREVMCRW